MSNSKDKLKGKCILVTGGARRLGAVIVRVLHDAGARLAVHYRHSATEAEALATELNTLRHDSAFCISCDLNHVETFSDFVAELLDRGGRLDALVNNASSFFATPLGSIGNDDWDDLVGSNFKAPLFLSQACSTHLKATGGCIVNIVDIHTEQPMPGYSLYAAAKGGLRALTRALAVDLAPKVRVNAVAPGAILWPEDGQYSAARRVATVEHTLLKRLGSPQDIAATTRFLVADAPYITGQIINVDGGRSAHLSV